MFYPARGDDHSSALGSALLLVTAGFGLAGIIVDIAALMRDDTSRGSVPGIAIVITGILVYILLLFGTKVFLHRIVTTELILIVGWTTLEVAVANAVYGYGTLNRSAIVLFLVIVAVASISSLILYLMYYNVRPTTGYILGMIPLITEAITMGVFVALTK